MHVCGQLISRFACSSFKKTSETLSTAGQKTSAAFSTLGSAISRRFEDMRYSVMPHALLAFNSLTHPVKSVVLKPVLSIRGCPLPANNRDNNIPAKPFPPDASPLLSLDGFFLWRAPLIFLICPCLDFFKGGDWGLLRTHTRILKKKQINKNKNTASGLYIWSCQEFAKPRGGAITPKGMSTILSVKEIGNGPLPEIAQQQQQQQQCGSARGSHIIKRQKMPWDASPPPKRTFVHRNVKTPARKIRTSPILVPSASYLLLSWEIKLHKRTMMSNKGSKPKNKTPGFLYTFQQSSRVFWKPSPCREFSKTLALVT